MSDYNLEGVIRLRDQTQQATDSASNGVNKLEGALKTARAALTAFGVVEAAKAVRELGELGAQAERTEQGFRTISGGSAEAEANLNAMIEATDGAIDRTSAMAVANQMMQMGLANSADELGRNAEMAVRLGRAMGVDALTAMENWNLMLANQSIPRLDTFGISSGRVRTRINELMEATEGLTREQAFNRAVMEEGAVAMERLGDAVDDNALAIEQSRAAWADLKNEIGIAFADAVAGAESGLGRFTRQWGDNLRILRENRDEIGIIRANLGMLGDALGFNNTIFDQYHIEQEQLAAQTDRLNAISEHYTRQQEAAAIATEGASSTIINLSGNVGTSAEMFRQYSEAIAASDAAAISAASAADSLGDSIGGVASQGDLARGAIDRLRDAIAQIPSRKEVEIIQRLRVERAGGMEEFIDDISGGNYASGFQGWVDTPTRMTVGEGGPEYVSVTPANQVQNTTNINVSMPQATNAGPAIQMLQALYGAN